MSLEKYNNKRDFVETTEPKGKKKKTNSKKLRFVIQYHRARAKHFDFRLEYNGVLLSWALPKGLSLNPKDKRLAVMVEDHPIDYMNFEGVIPKGNYGAGVVEIYDRGYYVPIEDMKEGLKKGNLKFALMGEKHKGIWNLVKTDDKNWILIKSNDEFAQNQKKDLPETKFSKNPFTKTSVMLATLSPSLPRGKDWLFEIKYDGYRIVAYKDQKAVKLITRNGLDYTSKFPRLEKSIQKIAKDVPFVLDGEVVMFDTNGRSDFGLLQSAIRQGKENVCYVAFDILALNGKDLRKTPLIKRKELLEKLLENIEGNIIYSSHIAGKGKEFFNMAKKLNLEGVVAKKANSLYVCARSEDWLKIKCYKRQEFVIGGYTTTDKNKELSALLVGYYKGNEFIYVGKVGTGFSDSLRKSLSNKFKKLVTTTCPFNEDLKQKAVWLNPKFIAEVKFAEITKDGLLRQPTFVGLREDKSPKDVKLEVQNGEWIWQYKNN